ncbi:MAG: hypothetical protein ACLRHW_16905 [Coprobacillus cateniformis]
MAEYGIKIVNFNINDISVPEDDSAVKKLKDALAKRAEMDIIGYSYQQERSFDTLEGAAKNEGGLGGMMGSNWSWYGRWYWWTNGTASWWFNKSD